MFHLRIMLTAMRALRQNLLRTLLATLGVVIGVGAVVAAVSILEGSQRQMLGQTEALGADQLIVLNGSRDRSHRRVMTNSLLPEDADSI
ncbi:MAG: ABC transporter permease, partial [Planctomycetes bacterium]|nr:ABC transporter permease [Planctomycetota bacterium]